MSSGFLRRFGAPLHLQGELYGLVYYFQKKHENFDADNISKPVWDALKNLMYLDDKQVKFRIACIYDLGKNKIKRLDFTGVDPEIISKLIESIDNRKYTLYIECGRFSEKHITFNLE